MPAPTNDEELWWATKVITGIEVPRERVCKNHVSPFDAYSDAYFARHSFTVWKGSRGLAGKSLLLALLGYMESIFLGAEEAILGGSGEQSKRVLAYQRMFWEHKNAPTYVLTSDPTTTRVTLNNGGSVTCLTASQRSARGIHPQRLRLDEIDEMDLAIFDAAMGQTMESTINGNKVRAQTVASSTHQNADGTMTEILRRAGERGYPVYEWCYWESHANGTGWLSESTIERKRNEVTSEMWRVEYDLGEPSIGNRAILTESVEAMFDPELGEVEGSPNQYHEFEPPLVIDPDGQQYAFETINHELYLSPYDGSIPAVTYTPVQVALELGYRMKGETEKRHTLPQQWFQCTYASGADWAKEQDWTIIVTLRTDCYPRRVVAYQRTGRLPWPVMIGKFDEQIARFPGRAIHDATGIGNVVKDFATNKAIGMVLGGMKYDALLTEYITACENGALVSPRIRHAYTEHKYCTNDAMYGSGHLPDTVCALALANRASKQVHRPII